MTHTQPNAHTPEDPRASFPPATRESSGLFEVDRSSVRPPPATRDSLADAMLSMLPPPALVPSAVPPPLDGRERAMLIVTICSLVVAAASMGVAAWAINDRPDTDPRAPMHKADVPGQGPLITPDETPGASPPETSVAADETPGASPLETPAAETVPVAARPPVRTPRPPRVETTPPATSAEPPRSDLDTLLDRALDPPGPPVPSELNELPSRDRVLRILRSASNEVQECGAGGEGVANTTLTIHGPTGRVRHVVVNGDVAGTSVGTCIARRLRDVRFPLFARERFQVSFPYRL